MKIEVVQRAERTRVIRRCGIIKVGDILFCSDEPHDETNRDVINAALDQIESFIEI